MNLNESVDEIVNYRLSRQICDCDGVTYIQIDGTPLALQQDYPCILNHNSLIPSKTSSKPSKFRPKLISYNAGTSLLTVKRDLLRLCEGIHIFRCMNLTPTLCQFVIAFFQEFPMISFEEVGYHGNRVRSELIIPVIDIIPCNSILCEDGSLSMQELFSISTIRNIPNQLMVGTWDCDILDESVIGLQAREVNITTVVDMSMETLRKLVEERIARKNHQVFRMKHNFGDMIDHRVLFDGLTYRHYQEQRRKLRSEKLHIIVYESTHNKVVFEYDRETFVISGI